MSVHESTAGSSSSSEVMLYALATGRFWSRWNCSSRVEKRFICGFLFHDMHWMG